MDGKALRDEALGRVADASGSWFGSALTQVASLQPGWEGTGEEINQYVAKVIGSPHDPHAWGSLISIAVKRGYLVKTGRWGQMKKPSSHARETKIYRVPPRFIPLRTSTAAAAFRPSTA